MIQSHTSNSLLMTRSSTIRKSHQLNSRLNSSWADLRDMPNHRQRCPEAQKRIRKLNRSLIVARKTRKIIRKSWYNKQVNSDYNLLKYINSFFNLSSWSCCKNNTGTATRLVELRFLITIRLIIALINVMLAIYLLECWIIFVDVFDFVDSVSAEYWFLHCRCTRVSCRTCL